ESACHNLSIALSIHLFSSAPWTTQPPCSIPKVYYCDPTRELSNSNAFAMREACLHIQSGRFHPTGLFRCPKDRLYPEQASRGRKQPECDTPSVSDRARMIPTASPAWDV